MRCSICNALISELAYVGDDGLPRCLKCLDEEKPASRSPPSLTPGMIEQRRPIRLSQVGMGFCLLYSSAGIFLTAPLSSIWRIFPFLLVAFGIDRRKTAAPVCGIICIVAMGVSTGGPFQQVLPGVLMYASFLALSVYGLERYHRLVRTHSPDTPAEVLADRRWITPWWSTLAVAYAGVVWSLGFYVFPTGSMEDTISIGDQVVVEKVSTKVGPPSRGDIIVFRYPIDEEQTFLKRVIGVPGDRIRIEHKELFVNGRKPVELYAIHKTPYEDAYRDNFASAANTQIHEPAVEMLEQNVEKGEIVVPDGKYFVMGDNRDLSLDSRYWGFLPEEFIIGKLFYVSWKWPWVRWINEWVREAN